MSRFISTFATKIDAMLENRLSRGLKEDAHLRNLLRFDKFCAGHFGEANELTMEVVYAWMDSEAEITQKGLNTKASTIRQLGKYLCAIGEAAYILPEKFVTDRSTFIPYIFTDDELSMLFNAIDAFPEDRNEPFLNLIAPIMFRLIYTCGLRPNEGRGLLRENVNFDTGEIMITKTKHNKDRIIVMSDDMLSLCKSYDVQRNIFSNSPYFFPAKDGGTFTDSKLLATLNKAWVTATCNPLNPIPKRIRVYDLRHRFASACLNRWLDEGRDLMVMLPYLRSYMGHGTMDETAYYIHILPENLTKSSAVDWSKFNEMFQGVVI